MKIVGTGLNGLVGSRIVELLGSRFDFENLSRTTGVDITNKEQVNHKIASSQAEIVLHMAAKANVDGCEEDKPLGQNGEAWQINVEGTRNVANACEINGKKLMYISTDFVFDGENMPEGGYSEIDAPNPVNWYGTTKCEGENAMQSISSPWTIVRISYPYRSKYSQNDFMRAMKSRLEKNEPLAGVTDHLFCPTFIDDIASAIAVLISKDAHGIYHVVGSQALSPFAAAHEIAQAFSYDETLISETTREKYFAGKAKRPFRLQLKNDKIKHLEVQIRSFTEGLIAVKNQLNTNTS